MMAAVWSIGACCAAAASTVGACTDWNAGALGWTVGARGWVGRAYGIAAVTVG